MTDAAIRIYLDGHPKLIAEWGKLRKRMAPASEAASYRNLVAHNPVKVTLARAGGVLVSVSAAPVQLPPVFTHSVHQDPVQVRVKARKALDADYADLRKACETLIQLHADLTDWLQRLP